MVEADRPMECEQLIRCDREPAGDDEAAQRGVAEQVECAPVLACGGRHVDFSQFAVQTQNDDWDQCEQRKEPEGHRMPDVID